jgi:hypothetical protein
MGEIDYRGGIRDWFTKARSVRTRDDLLAVTIMPGHNT